MTHLGVRDGVLQSLTQPAPGSADPGSLEVLREIDAADLPRWKKALEQWRPSGFGYYFPYVLAHQGAKRRVVLVAEDGGCLCSFILRERRKGGHLDVYLPPMPMDVKAAQRCLERANEFNGDRSARILRIDARDAPRVAKIPGVSVRERRKQYIYAPNAYADLSGGEYQALRRQLTRTQQLNGLETVPYSERYASDCRKLLERWAQRHRSTHGTSGDAGLSKRALGLADVLSVPDLTGEVFLLGGRVVGYWLGGEIRQGLGCFLDGKSDVDVPELGYFQRYRFLTTHGGFQRVNDGSDARRPELRELKDSFRPVEMHSEYRGRQAP